MWDKNDFERIQPYYTPIESFPLRNFEMGAGGDIHNTVDTNPDSQTFGDVHWTMRLPGTKSPVWTKDFHGPDEE
jgi:hypothetical protein